MYDLTRANWGARPTKYTRLDWARVRHLILHYPGELGAFGTDQAAIARAMRRWQDFHIDTRRWTDIAYNVAVDQAGRVWEGRGFDRRDGATSGMGGVSFSVLAILGNNEQPSDAMKAGILRVFAEANRRTPAAARSIHSRFVSTSCPGDALRRWGNAGFPAPATPQPDVPAPAPKPATTEAPAFPLAAGCHSHGRDAYFGPRYPLKNARSVSGYYTHREDLRAWQQRMADRKWRITPDGYYGDETERVVRAFQREKGLSVDGVIGAATWAAAWTSPVT